MSDISESFLRAIGRIVPDFADTDEIWTKRVPTGIRFIGLHLYAARRPGVVLGVEISCDRVVTTDDPPLIFAELRVCGIALGLVSLWSGRK